MFDASTPPNAMPAGYNAVAGYIGGETPHVWTQGEWARFGKVKKLPIWVRSLNGTPSGYNDAWRALEMLYLLNVPKGSPVVADMEARVDVIYLNAFYKVLTWAGYQTWVYGSTSTLFRNPVCDGWWVADPTDTPHKYPVKGQRATQYAFLGNIDASVVNWWAYTYTLKTW